ncbi:MAG: arsenosugar biosynthesis radical SAM protein ArsS [Eubacteriales bacterium]|nr:arsenosugar biosynthesis radical SAM protein ArsS [Eubacteriales bacterium]
MERVCEEIKSIPGFSQICPEAFQYTSEQPKVLQINVGRKCNLACKHCHLNCGPDRTEMISRSVLSACLSVYRKHGYETIDITGGAPELCPDLKWFICEAEQVCSDIIVRSNATVWLEDGFGDYPEFFAAHHVTLFLSLPYYRAKEADRQRGEGNFDREITCIRRLNSLGYGKDPDKILNFVYNPNGALLPPPQEAMEAEYRLRLAAEYGIVFNNLFCLTNNPIGRFGAFLKRSGNLERYMQKLYGALNPETFEGMMCRTQISVGYDGSIYDCDFNQAADIPVAGRKTIFDLANESYQRRRIVFGRHCYGCTAGAGSS